MSCVRTPASRPGLGSFSLGYGLGLFVRGLTLEKSVSLLFPVHNAQRTLARNVSGVLDILPDLTDRFEVLIVDDGSTDGTDEVAEDLARQYPQVNVVRHDRPRGLAESINTALAHSQGEIVFVPDPQQDFEPEALGQLWRLRDDLDVAIAQRTKPECGLRMLRRDEVLRLQQAGIPLAGESRAMPVLVDSDTLPHDASRGFLGAIGSFLAAE